MTDHTHQWEGVETETVIFMELGIEMGGEDGDEEIEVEVEREALKFHERCKVCGETMETWV